MPVTRSEEGSCLRHGTRVPQAPGADLAASDRSPRDNARQIVLRPLESPNSASSSASSPEGKKLSLEKARKKVAERVGLLAAGDGRSSCASLGPPRPRRGVQNRSAIFVEPAGSSTHPAPPIKKGLKNRPFFIGGEGGIRTHVPELPDHPISSRRRCDHFGTSPVNLKFLSVYLSFYAH